jgi:hypothetical protein
VRPLNPLSTSHPEPNLSALVASILGVTVVKHMLIRSHRAPPIFVINAPCRSQAKEARKEKWRDFIETNQRETGLTGQGRDLHLAYFRLAQVDRREGRKAQAEKTLGKSRKLRIQDAPWNEPPGSMSPMAAAEGRVEVRIGRELLRRLRAGRR